MWIVYLIIGIFLCSLFLWGIVVLILTYLLKEIKSLLRKFFRIFKKDNAGKDYEYRNVNNLIDITENFPTSFDKTIKINDENIELKVENKTYLTNFIIIDNIEKKRELLEKEKLNINNLEIKITLVLGIIKDIDNICEAILRNYIKGEAINKLYNYYIKLKLNLIKMREKFFSEKIKAESIQRSSSSNICPNCYAEISNLLDKKCPKCNNPFIIYKTNNKVYLLNEKQYYLL